MYQTKHFVTGSFVSHASHVDDRTYSLILDNIVKATCDIFLVRRETPDGKPLILMGERVGLPHADWWIPGGRMVPGETVAKCCKRVLHRELGIHLGDDEIAEARVRTVSHFTFVWDTRTQEPIHNGTCDVSIILRVDVSENEASRVSLNHKEYKQLEWRSLESQVQLASCRQLPAPGLKPLHPALAQGIRDLDAMMKWDELVAVLQARVAKQPEASNVAKVDREETDDASIVKRLVEFCGLRGELAPLASSLAAKAVAAVPSPARSASLDGTPQPDGFVHKHHGDTHATSYHPQRQH